VIARGRAPHAAHRSGRQTRRRPAPARRPPIAVARRRQIAFLGRIRDEADLDQRRRHRHAHQHHEGRLLDASRRHAGGERRYLLVRESRELVGLTQLVGGARSPRIEASGSSGDAGDASRKAAFSRSGELARCVVARLECDEEDLDTARAPRRSGVGVDRHEEIGAGAIGDRGALVERHVDIVVRVRTTRTPSLSMRPSSGA